MNDDDDDKTKTRTESVVVLGAQGTSRFGDGRWSPSSRQHIQ